MPAITDNTPDTWEELEEIVTAILCECGMDARRQVRLSTPRGTITVDAYAEETTRGIVQSIVCECKYWKSNIPSAVIREFRTVMQETGAHRGYIISRAGFQRGAVEAAVSTNIELLTFSEFQDIYFEKWIHKRLWDIEEAIGDFNTYYEPIGRPGYSQLKSEEERSAYDEVWNKYLFAGLMLMPFSPYVRMIGSHPIPELPLNISEMESRGVQIPDDIKMATAYREFFEIIQIYARVGLSELRAVNPITRGKPPETITRDD